MVLHCRQARSYSFRPVWTWGEMKDKTTIQNWIEIKKWKQEWEPAIYNFEVDCNSLFCLSAVILEQWFWLSIRPYRRHLNCCTGISMSMGKKKIKKNSWIVYPSVMVLWLTVIAFGCERMGNKDLSFCCRIYNSEDMITLH